jgi:hypothetical protein
MTDNEILVTTLLVLAVICIEVTACLQPLWLRLLIVESRWKLGEWRARAVMGIAFWLPRWLVRAAAIRLFAYATTGRYGATLVPELTAIEALKRWETSK